MKERRTKEKRKAWAHSIIASHLAFCHASKVFPGEVTTAAQTAAYVGGKCLVHRKRGSKLPHERHGRSALYHEHSKYVPHEIELAWLDKAKDPEVDTCEHHRAHPEEAEANLKWMNAVQSLSNLKADEELMDTPDESNLSKFVFYRSYKRGTNRTTEQWTEWIEPLVGITRHPFSLCHPLNVSIPKNLIASIFNIDYLLLQPDGKESIASRGRHGGKKFLFDLGTNYFRTGLGALLCKYSMAGVEFDEIYAWEAGAVNRQLYWDNVPKELHRRLHFYNIPVSADPMNTGEPLALVLNKTERDDFVAFKLDIDSPEIEMNIVQSILNNPALSELIDELFFEYHYESPIMAQWWGHTKEKGLGHALRLFYRLRSKGIRAHFWP